MNRFVPQYHFLSGRCMIGTAKWHRRMVYAGKKKYPGFRRCSFFVQYRRYFNEVSGERGPFELYKFDLTHTHPLALEYARCEFDNDN